MRYRRFSCSTLYTFASAEFLNLSRQPVVGILLLVYLTMFFVAIGPFGRAPFLRTIPAALPYVIFRLLNLIQVIAAVVIAGQSWADEYHCDTLAAIHARSYSNPSYVAGKLLGQAAVFLLINMALMLLTFAAGLLGANEVGTPLALFVRYLLIIPLPTMLFASGMTALTMRFVKNQGMAVSMLCTVCIVLFATSGASIGFITDPTAFQIPLFHSEFVGFGNGRMIALHRGMYVLLGLGCSALAAVTFDRLRQSVVANAVTIAVSVLCLFGAYRCGSDYLSTITDGRHIRETINELNRAHADDLLATVAACDLAVIHDGDEIDVTAHLSLTNENGMAVGRYLFSLNPGLDVLSVTGNDGGECAFSRDCHLLAVTPDIPLEPGGDDLLVIHYIGVIDEQACYPELDEAGRLLPNEYGRTVIDKRYAYITPRFVLLTDETLWYPVAGARDAGLYCDMSDRTFTQYSLTVITSPGLTAISQGASEQQSETTWAFTPETPLPQLSLVVGEYEQHHLTVDGVPVTFYLKPGHETFSQPFTALDGAGLETYLGERKREFESLLRLTYPFARYSIVEVPVSFLAYPRFRPYAPANVQPEQVFWPERSAFVMAYFKGLIESYSVIPGVATLLDAEKTAIDRVADEIFEITSDRAIFRERRDTLREWGSLRQKMIWNTYSQTNIYDFSLFPQYYWFSKAVDDGSLAGLDLLIGSYLHRCVPHNDSVTNRDPNDIAKSVLRNRSFRAFLDDPAYIDIGHEVVEIKAREFVQSCIARAATTEDEFKNFLTGFLEQNRFGNVDGDVFAEEYQKTFGVDIRPVLTTAYEADRLPTYEVSDVEVTTVEDNRVRRHNFTTTIQNVSDVPGVLRASVSDIGNMGQELNFVLEPGEAKMIGFVSEMPYSSAPHILFTTYLAKNEYRMYAEADDTGGVRRGVPFEGVETIPTPPTARERGYIEVDNLDDGFVVLPEPVEHGIRATINAWFAQNRPPVPMFATYRVTDPPESWTLTRQMGFLGLEYGVHYVKSGDGSRCVQWETDIVTSGTYEIGFYFPGKFLLTSPDPSDKKLRVRDMHFTISHAGGDTEQVIDVQDSEPGWVSLGTYVFMEGPARITLSNRSTGTLVFADAVRWAKKE